MGELSVGESSGHERPINPLFFRGFTWGAPLFFLKKERENKRKKKENGEEGEKRIYVVGAYGLAGAPRKLMIFSIANFLLRSILLAPSNKSPQIKHFLTANCPVAKIPRTILPVLENTFLHLS